MVLALTAGYLIHWGHGHEIDPSQHLQKSCETCLLSSSLAGLNTSTVEEASYYPQTFVEFLPALHPLTSPYTETLQPIRGPPVFG